MATTKNISRLFSAVSQNSVYSDTCTTVKKNVQKVYNEYNKKSLEEKEKIKYITDIKYTIFDHKTVNDLTILCELPGVNAQSIKMMFCGCNLMISCDKNLPNTFKIPEQDEKIENILLGNAKYGIIKFNITLPIIVNKTKHIKFNYQDGILKIIIPKTKDQDPILITFK